MPIARALATALPALLAGPAAADPTLFGVQASGELVRINTATGAGTLVGSSGFGCNAATADHAGHILIGGGAGAQADQIIALDPATGAGSVFLATSGRPAGYGITGMALTPSNTLYVVLSQASTTTLDILATIDLATGVYNVIGATGRTDLQALASSPDGTLYAIGVNAGGTFCRISPVNGAATVIGGGTFAGDDQALDFFPSGTAFACRANLRVVDIGTGATTLIGPTGFSDIRGLAVLDLPPPPCYPNCDGSTAAPVLNVADFTCFLQRFAASDPYANCDGSTTAPVLNVADFTCFLQSFAAGCP